MEEQEVTNVAYFCKNDEKFGSLPIQFNGNIREILTARFDSHSGSFNPSMPKVPLIGQKQSMQTQIRYHNMPDGLHCLHNTNGLFPKNKIKAHHAGANAWLQLLLEIH